MWYKVFLNISRRSDFDLCENHVLKIRFFRRWGDSGRNFCTCLKPLSLYGLHLIQESSLIFYKRKIFDINKYLSDTKFNEWCYYKNWNCKMCLPIDECPYIRE